MNELFKTFTIKERETRKRILISVYAYAYEIKDTSIINDFKYDELALEIDLKASTNRPDLDLWFQQNYHSCTGGWIYEHPELDKIKNIYDTHFKDYIQ